MNNKKKTVKMHACYCDAFDLEIICPYVSVNTQEHLAHCFYLKIPKLEPQLRHH